MADESPCDATLLELLSRDFAGKSTVRLVENVLSGDLDTLAEVLAGEKKVKRGRGDDDLYMEA